MQSIWDIRATLDAKENEQGSRAELFFRCYTTFNSMTDTIIRNLSKILKTITAELRNSPGKNALNGMLPGYLSLVRYKESIGNHRAYVSGLICLPRHYTTPPELRDDASAEEAQLSDQRMPFTAMDSYKEIFECVGSQASFHRLFEETCLDDDLLTEFRRIESSVPHALKGIKDVMGRDPFRGLTEVRVDHFYWIHISLHFHRDIS